MSTLQFSLPLPLGSKPVNFSQWLKANGAVVKRRGRITAVLFLLACLVACGGAQTDEGEDYGDLMETEEGLTITQEEHLVGWGETQCHICHPFDNIHRKDRINSLNVEVSVIQDQVVSEGVSSCPICHLPNGF